MSHESDLASTAVADNLRRLRKQHKMSLDDLSQRSGVSKTMLHQIESYKSTPTISLLWKIATGLAVPFSTLIQQEQAAGLTVLHQENAKLLFNSEQTFSSRALFPYDGTGRKAEFYELRIKPGGHENAEPHANGTIENLVLVSGETVTITLGTQTACLKPGDAVVFDADVPHQYRNDSTTKEAVLYLVMTYAKA